MRLKKAVLLAFVLVLFVTGLVVGFVKPTVTDGTIYIMEDGSVDPSTAPIERDGDIYTLTGNIVSDTDAVVIERNNMTLDGAGYSIHGTERAYDYHFDYAGIRVSEKSNVTIKNTDIKGFTHGVRIDSSSHNTLFGNKITNNRYGVFLRSSSYNLIFASKIATNEYYGIMLTQYSSNNYISENEITGNIDAGIFLTIYSSYNTISGNYITPRGGGIWIWQYSENNCFVGNTVENRYAINLDHSSNNHIYGNNFMNGTIEVSIENSINIWDNGFEGNYWSDYGGKDTDSDGVGDTPYMIDGKNQDNYPLMNFLSKQEQTRITHHDLLRKLNELLANHSRLNATYNDLEALQETTTSDLNYIRNLMYVFIVTTIIFIATTVYFALRKPKTLPSSISEA